MRQPTRETLNIGSAGLAGSTSRPCMHLRVRGCTPWSMHAACVDASRQSTARSTRTSSTFLLASSYPPTPSYILAWGQHVTTSLSFSKRRARRLASGQKESCINSKGKRLESAEKRSRITAVSKYGRLHDRLLLRSPPTESRNDLEPRNNPCANQRENLE